MSSQKLDGANMSNATIDFCCPHCGRFTRVDARFAGQTGPCRECGQTITIPRSANPFLAQAAPPPLGDDAGMRMLLPVGRSVWAIIAGYLGLFSVLFFPAPLAIVAGILAIRDMRRHPELHGMGRAVFGLVMGALGTIVLIFVVIAAIAG
ncbi:MAG: DUF4190 domain-containing protein [Pirellulales bacterium]|nr:DUF4190 domain-containing protein [Pirellulales bacterium]